MQTATRPLMDPPLRRPTLRPIRLLRVRAQPRPVRLPDRRCRVSVVATRPATRILNSSHINTFTSTMNRSSNTNIITTHKWLSTPTSRRATKVSINHLIRRQQHQRNSSNRSSCTRPLITRCPQPQPDTAYMSSSSTSHISNSNSSSPGSWRRRSHGKSTTTQDTSSTFKANTKLICIRTRCSRPTRPPPPWSPPPRTTRTTNTTNSSTISGSVVAVSSCWFGRPCPCPCPGPLSDHRLILSIVILIQKPMLTEIIITIIIVIKTFESTWG